MKAAAARSTNRYQLKKKLKKKNIFDEVKKMIIHQRDSSYEYKCIIFQITWRDKFNQEQIIQRYETNVEITGPNASLNEYERQGQKHKLKTHTQKKRIKNK